MINVVSLVKVIDATSSGSLPSRISAIATSFCVHQAESLNVIEPANALTASEETATAAAATLAKVLVNFIGFVLHKNFLAFSYS